MRLGSIEFINSLPVDLGLISGQIPWTGDIVSGAPTLLNQKILKNELDISPVSALWLAEHADDFLILPDLSISSESAVDSVLLFSKIPIQELRNRTILVTSKGRTTPALLEILCRQHYGFTPNIQSIKEGELGLSEKTDAILLIGDEALIWKACLGSNKYHVTDLAKIWREWTGFGFVFALWAARRDVFNRAPESVWQAYQTILKSRDFGLTHRDQILKKSEEKTGLPQQILEQYFSKLSYSLDKNLKQGLDLYLKYAHQCGLLKEEVPTFKEITKPEFSPIKN